MIRLLRTFFGTARRFARGAFRLLVAVARRLWPGRRARRALLLAFVIWLCALIGLGAALERAGRDDRAQVADAIIVLGSGLRRDGSPGDALWRRSRWAAQRYADGLAPAIICTGGTTPGYARSEADGCRQVLQEFGVPAAAITLEDRSRSTEENALYAAEIMAARGWDDAVLVTDSFHMLRASWIFDAQGIVHYPSPAPRDWVRTAWYLRLAARELIALHWQLVKDALNLPFTSVPFG